MFWDKKFFLEFWEISILCTNLNFPFKLGYTDRPGSTKSWFLFLSWDCLEFFWGQTIYHRKNGHHNQICQWWFFYLHSILSYGQKYTILFSQIYHNDFFQKTHPYYFLKPYIHTKFQLIWPSNNEENQNNTLLKKSGNHPVYGPVWYY